MGGGGGGTDINQIPGGFRNWGKESPDIKKGYDFNIGEFGNFVQNNPLLKAAQTGSLDFWGQLPGMLSQFKGFGQELGGYQKQLGQLGTQLGGYGSKLGAMIPGIQGQFGVLNKELQNLTPNFSKFLGAGSGLSQAYGGANGIGATLASHGALSRDQLNAAIQGGRVSGAQSGSLQDPSGLIQDYVSRKSSTDANFNQALGQSQSVLGQQAGAAQGLEGIYGQQANLRQLGTQLTSGILGQQAGISSQRGALDQLGAGLTGQKAGLLGQQQGLQTGGLNQLLGVGNAAVSQFGGLTNPILSYMQGIFGGNQQAAIQQAQIGAQQDASGSAKTGGAISSIGSIIGGVAMAY